MHAELQALHIHTTFKNLSYSILTFLKRQKKDKWKLASGSNQLLLDIAAVNSFFWIYLLLPKHLNLPKLFLIFKVNLGVQTRQLSSPYVKAEYVTQQLQ